jgi:predicted HTH domain antitoxin
MKIEEEYTKGNITLSEAAEQAGLTIWEMERYLIENGFKSSYSIEDLEKEIKLLK